jgi:hypothetical protein
VAGATPAERAERPLENLQSIRASFASAYFMSMTWSSRGRKQILRAGLPPFS